MHLRPPSSVSRWFNIYRLVRCSDCLFANQTELYSDTHTPRRTRFNMLRCTGSVFTIAKNEVKYTCK